MSTSVSYFPETDLDIRFTEKKKKINYKMDLNNQHSNIQIKFQTFIMIKVEVD